MVESQIHTSLLPSDSDSGTLDPSSPTTVLDTLSIFRAILDSMSSISICSAQRAGVGTEDWTCHFPF